MSERHSGSEPERRFVLLGASNLSFGLRASVRLIDSVTGPGSQLYIASGLGRSYCAWSRVLARGLPGVASCGLWPALESARPVPTYALLTDVGNDIAYGRSPQEIRSRIESCLVNLDRLGARGILTRLPLRSLSSMGRLRYHFVKGVFFRGRSLPYTTMLERVIALDRALTGLVEQYGCRALRPEPDWFWPDAIHLRPRGARALATRLLELWGLPVHRSRSGPQAALGAPEIRTWFGRPVRSAQPTGISPSGLQIHRY